MTIPFLSLSDLRQHLQQGNLTCEDLVLSLLKQIQAVEPQVKAWQWLDPEHALQRARDHDAHKEQWAPLPLRGIPIGVKDIFSTSGIPTTMGSPLYAHHIPDFSATVVEKLEAAGALILGKTVTTEFAYQYPGKTCNPWNPDHTPGGSSSGSAAAVAAGMVPLALGTQTMGSIIRPAAFCGVVGYKPSYGLISRYGVHPFSPTLDHVGVFARNVQDAWQLVSVISGKDPRDPSTEDQFFPASPALLNSAPTLGILKTPWWSQVEKVQKQHFLEIIVQLQRAGAHIEAVISNSVLAEGPDLVMTIMAYEAAKIYQPIAGQNPDKISQSLCALIKQGQSISTDQYQKALSRRKQIQLHWQEISNRFDAIVTLPTPGPAPKGLAFTGDATFCKTWTLLGIPTLTLPTGQTLDPLPLATQILGRFGQDVHLLRVAGWCESVLIPVWKSPGLLRP